MQKAKLVPQYNLKKEKEERQKTPRGTTSVEAAMICKHMVGRWARKRSMVGSL